ncbi:hypothetical protein [Glycomyces arizonensis]|uniref:hypothetical protein n=1 Tax=Glycomyces arizonensis TaxID=256035 RepID=UPI0003F58632|nr:hypothetical protein [Glycomyces arizonensis]
MGLFGAIGRETKGAIRSFNYDVHHSKRFRQLGVLAVAAVAGGVMATGLLVRTPVPELIGVEADQDGSDVTGGWSGHGAGTQAQDAEASPEASGGVPAPSEATGSAAGQGAPSAEAGKTDTQAGAPEATPGLTPIEKPGGPASEESDAAATETPETEPEPSETPTTTSEPSPSGTPTEQPTPTKTPSASPTPTKTPIGE